MLLIIQCAKIHQQMQEKLIWCISLLWHHAHTNIVLSMYNTIIVGHRWIEGEGFHVMSYHAKFASHHTHNRHVGFLLHSTVLETQLTFNSVHTTIPNYNWYEWQEYILSENVKPCHEVDQILISILSFFYTAPYKKGNQGARQSCMHIDAYRIM